MTWPIEEMPYDDVAGFCLAAPQNYVSGKDLSELPCAVEMIICAICLDEKGRFLPMWLSQRIICMTITLSKLLLSILPKEYEILIVGGLVRSGEGDIDNYRQADYITSGGALSKAIIY
jgi:hypothetical protein